MKNVLIKIIGTHGYDEETDEPIELVSEGKIDQDKEGLFVEYEESEISGSPGSITRVYIKDSTVTMRRKDESGNTVGNLVFEKGKRHEGDLTMFFRTMNVEILASSIENTITYNDPGRLDIEYDIAIAGLSSSSSKISIEVLKEGTL